MNTINKTSRISFTAKPIPRETVLRIFNELNHPRVKTVDIFCHTSPDEDTMNSAKVFYNWLKKSLKKEPVINVERNSVDKLYRVLRKCKQEEFKRKNLEDYSIADKTVLLDFNSLERLSPKNKVMIFETLPSNILGLDHHAVNERTISDNIYIDLTAKSNCGVLYRFFEALGYDIPKQDRKSLFCGMVSDYKKSGYVEVIKEGPIYNLYETDKLQCDADSKEVFVKLAESLTINEKHKIYEHLDYLAHLSPGEKRLQNKLFSKFQMTPDRRLAYVVISPEDSIWGGIGMDNPVTSEILKDFRVRILKNSPRDDFLAGRNPMLTSVKNVAVFYRKSPESNEYRISIHSKNNKAMELLDIAHKYNPNIIYGGHPDRAGGKVNSVKKYDIDDFVAAIIKASDEINRL